MHSACKVGCPSRLRTAKSDMNLTVDFSILGHASMALSAMWRRPENRCRDERDERKESAHEPVNLTGIRSEAFAEDLEDLEYLDDLQDRKGLLPQAAMPLPAR